MTTAGEWLTTILTRCPAAGPAIAHTAHICSQMLPYQSAALFELVHPYDAPVCHFLEIGTASGHSAAMMAEAAPRAAIVTLNAAAHEVPRAIETLLPWPGVTVRFGVSWEVLETYRGPYLDVVFVDGDHRRASLDAPWFNWLVPGGLILFHDYTPAGSAPVVDAVQRMSTVLCRPADVMIVDAAGIGMAGFYRHNGQERVWDNS